MLWAALAINAVMFVVEVVVAVAAAGSASLLADSLDFLADGASYAISLLVLGSALAVRAKAVLAKGISLGVFIGLAVAGNVVYVADLPSEATP